MESLSIASAGAMAAAQRFSVSASRMVTGEGDLASEVVQQVSAKTDFAANLAVVRTADEMLGRLLDIKA